MKTLNQMIGEKLKTARENSGLSLRAAGELLGKNHSTIHSYESGKRAINVDVMEELCNYYGVSYLELLSEVYYERKLLTDKK
ncbi:helix-turn-helix transcriptional regulator [Erysipelothrix sp. HDW6C]|uniref:helix-turn-helix domain-containing protein n=1 Tax=Erysipelothrix sp. HDW6C TaxID=2714930 RepID=UPI00140BCCD4|nr:helix-turn-helix transcriptional regulator [Erysipelothrix sp. HDW6C]QIK68769.1 helix-turn-helix transcriptional regulator [Erysipelothrix sp. HDW6C]